MRALLAAALLFVPPAHAARPMVTDDARPLDEGGVQLEMFYKRQRPGPPERRFGTVGMAIQF